MLSLPQRTDHTVPTLRPWRQEPKFPIKKTPIMGLWILDIMAPPIGARWSPFPRLTTGLGWIHQGEATKGNLGSSMFLGGPLCGFQWLQAASLVVGPALGPRG